MVNFENKKCVGFWYSKSEPFYPKPEASSDGEWIKDNTNNIFADKLELIQSLLKNNKIDGDYCQYRGLLPCRMCKKWNGSAEYECGDYIWPSGYTHYIREHNIKPPQDFIDFINNMELPKIKLKLRS